MVRNEQDWLGFVVVYTAARLGLLLSLVLLGAFSGAVLFPSVITFLPYSMIDVKNFFAEPTVKSVIATLVICLFYAWVFYDDARKHTAYEEWSLTNILIVLILIGVLYFIPAIFRDSFNEEGKGEIFYKVLYYPAGWVIRAVGDNYLIGVLLSISVMLGTALGAYIISYRSYVKKHPVLLGKNRQIAADDGVGGDGEEDA